MTVALRRQFRQNSLPQVSFGPLRFLEALPWLVMAAAMRVIAFGGGAVAIPAIIVASIAVLHAFLVVAQRSIELADGQTNLGELDFREQFSLSKAVLGRIALLMFAVSSALLAAGYKSFAPHMMDGLDGMAFDQWTDIGKFWSATIAALILLMIVDAERNGGQVSFFKAGASSRGAASGSGLPCWSLASSISALASARDGSAARSGISGRFRRRASSSRT